MEYLLIAYGIGYLGTFIFIWYSLAHIGVYWYQFNRLTCIRGHLGILFWPLLPLLFLYDVWYDWKYPVSVLKKKWTDEFGRNHEIWGSPDLKDDK
jgi:hypothetical protein